MKPPDAASPLRYLAFRWLMAGRCISLLGTAIAPVALAFAVLDLTGSVSDLGVVLAARSVPMLVFLLVGGVVADRLPRQRVLLASNIVSAVSQGIVALLLLRGDASIPALVVLEIIGGSSAAFLWPALAGLTPQTVPAPALQQANALLRLASNTSFIGGSAAAGLLVATLGPGLGLAIDSATYGLGAVCLSRIRLPRGERMPHASALAELLEGWGEFRSRTWVWVIVATFAFVNAAFTGFIATLGPAVADATFGRTGWGLVLAAVTAGMFLGGLISLRMKPQRPLLLGTCGVLLAAPLLGGLAWQPRLWLLLGLGVVAGLGLETFTVYWDLSLQQHIPLERLSRVSSYDSLGSFAFIPLGQLAAGPLSRAVGVDGAFGIAAGVVLLATGLALATPSVRGLRRTDGPRREHETVSA